MVADGKRAGTSCPAIAAFTAISAENLGLIWGERGLALTLLREARARQAAAEATPACEASVVAPLVNGRGTVAEMHATMLGTLDRGVRRLACSSDAAVLVFFRFYEPPGVCAGGEHGRLALVGRALISPHATPRELLPELRVLAGLEADVALLVYEEVTPLMVNALNMDKTFSENEMIHGDILCFQRAATAHLIPGDLGTVAGFLARRTNTRTIRFRPATIDDALFVPHARSAESAAPHMLKLELSTHLSVGKFLEKLAAQLCGVAEPTRLQFRMPKVPNATGLAAYPFEIPIPLRFCNLDGGPPKPGYRFHTLQDLLTVPINDKGETVISDTLFFEVLPVTAARIERDPGRGRRGTLEDTANRSHAAREQKQANVDAVAAAVTQNSKKSPGDEHGWLGKLNVGDVVELKVRCIGYLPAVISHIDVATAKAGVEKLQFGIQVRKMGAAMRASSARVRGMTHAHVPPSNTQMTVCWDPPDGFCSVDIDDPEQRGWLRPHAASSAASWALTSSDSAGTECVPRVDNVIKQDTGLPHLKPGQFIIERIDEKWGVGRFVVDDVKALGTVAKVKQKLCEQHGISPEQFHLMDAGRVLADERLFSEYKITPRSRIRLVENADANERLIVRLRETDASCVCSLREVRALLVSVLFACAR